MPAHPNLRISEIRRSLRGDSGLRLMLDKLRCLVESRQFRSVLEEGL